MAITNEDQEKKNLYYRIAGTSVMFIFVLGLAAYALIKTFSSKESAEDRSCPDDYMEACCAEQKEE